MASPVVSLAECHRLPRTLIGGKTLALAELAAAGFRVPDGFCITTDGCGQSAKMDCYPMT